MQATHARLAPLASTLLATLAPAAFADGEILSATVIDDTQGGLGAVLSEWDIFGYSVDCIGDLDGDGNADLVVGAPGNDLGFQTNEGAVWIVFLHADGTVKTREKLLSYTPHAEVGLSVASLGDVDGDGNTDVLVGSYLGGARIYYLQPDGTSNWNYTMSSAPSGSPNYYGYGVGAAGDIDGDGVPDALVGAPDTSWGSPERLYVLFMNSSGTIKSSTEIGPGVGGFLGAVGIKEGFGWSATGLGDLNGDGIGDVAVSTPYDDGDGSLWILYLEIDGTVKHEVRIQSPEATGGFGVDLKGAGDLDGNGVQDLIVGCASGDVYLLFLAADGSLRTYLRYEESDLLTTTGMGVGRGVATMPDLDGNGSRELIVGLPYADTGGLNHGGIEILAWEGVSMASYSPLGCQLNPAGSLVPSGPPILGSTVSFQLDNPLGSQSPGSLSFLALSTTSATGGGSCGLPLPGYHMNPSQPTGELLVAPPFDLSILGTLWAPGAPAEVQLTIPYDPALLGLELAVQGAIVDPTGGASGSSVFGLTRGLNLRIGT